jgi:peptidoglycan/xylan/chitin deacetylase (PgdA/CDA1 family)
VIKAAAETADLVLGSHRGVVILLYHRTQEVSDSEMNVRPHVFAAQMEVLKREASVLALPEALRAVTLPEPPRLDPVVVSFDDGTKDFADVALPILIRHAVPTVLYLATAFVEQQRPFPLGGKPLSWSALRDALTTGLLTIGSHTHDHLLLDRVSPSTAREQIDVSISLIEDRLGVHPMHFAYPKAIPGSPAAQAWVRHRFQSAALAGTRPNRYRATDAYRLYRSPVHASDRMRWFQRKLGGGMWLEGSLGKVMNPWRYRGHTS